MSPGRSGPRRAANEARLPFRSSLPGLAGLVLLLSFARPVRAAPPPQERDDPIPLLAYYYIWFDPGSWERAKADLPLLGRYSSDDKEVMRQHVQWAKEVGIDGFIVSWKSTDRLNQRLDQLVEVAAEHSFKLVIIYQGLDFERRPLPVDRIAADLDYFLVRYADEEAFRMFGRPLVIWSGTWEFSPEEIAQVTERHRKDLFILASERHTETYLSLAGLVDGNAYYWSSVDPGRTPGYQEKLDEMGRAVHAQGGLWIAPAAPGFDARLIGGARVVERRDGATLRQELEAAFHSSPDAVGLISWNEFSENTHVEPSRTYGMHYLEVLADVRGGVIPKILDFDSSEPAGTLIRPDGGRLAPFVLLGGLAVVSLVVIVWRRMAA